MSNPAENRAHDTRVVIDIAPWYAETRRLEPEFRNVPEAYAEANDEGLSYREASRHYFVKQRLGAVEEDIFDPTGRLEFEEGVYHRFLERAPLVEVTRPSAEGKERVVGRYRQYTSDDGTIVASKSLEGQERWHNYLMTMAYGHVRRSLTALLACGVDIRAVWAEFAARVETDIEGMVNPE